MKAKFFILVTLLNFYSLSSSAEAATSKCKQYEDFKGSGIGDIKYSLLGEQKFQKVNGDEWVILGKKSKREAQLKKAFNEYDSDQKIFEYFDEKINNSMTALPDARGMFFRVINDGSKKLGSYEKGSVQNHIHNLFGSIMAISGPKTNKRFYLSNSKIPNSTEAWFVDASANNHKTGMPYSKVISDNVSGFSTKYSKPENIAVNAYVKVKLKCLSDKDIDQDKRIRELERLVKLLLKRNNAE